MIKLNDYLSIINEITTFVSGLCVTGITVYMAYRQFWQKQIDMIGFSFSMPVFHGENITLTLINRGVAPLSVANIDIILNNKYCFNLFPNNIIQELNEEEKILYMEHGKHYKLKSRSWSSLFCYQTNLYTYFYQQFKEMFLLVWLSGEKNPIKVKYTGRVVKKKYIGQLFLPYNRLIPFTSKFKGVVHSIDVKYGLTSKKENGEDLIGFIDTKGLISKEFLELNPLPFEVLENINTLKEYIKTKNSTIMVENIEGYTQLVEHRFIPKL